MGANGFSYTSLRLKSWSVLIHQDKTLCCQWLVLLAFAHDNEQQSHPVLLCFTAVSLLWALFLLHVVLPVKSEISPVIYMGSCFCHQFSSSLYHGLDYK